MVWEELKKIKKFKIPAKYPIQFGKEVLLLRDTWHVRIEGEERTQPWNEWRRQYANRAPVRAGDWSNIDHLPLLVSQWPLDTVLDMAVHIASSYPDHASGPLFVMSRWELQVRDLCTTYSSHLARLLSWCNGDWVQIKIPTHGLDKKIEGLVPCYDSDNGAFHLLCRLCIVLPGVFRLSTKHLPNVDILNSLFMKRVVSVMGQAMSSRFEVICHNPLIPDRNPCQHSSV